MTKLPNNEYRMRACEACGAMCETFVLEREPAFCSPTCAWVAELEDAADG
jgi:hypothetical protein